MDEKIEEYGGKIDKKLGTDSIQDLQMSDEVNFDYVDENLLSSLFDVFVVFTKQIC